MLIAILYKYIRKMDVENQRLVEEARRLEEERRQFWLSLYGQAPAATYEPLAQAPQAQRQLPFYEEAEEKPQRGAPTAGPTPVPYPTAADGFFRVIPCPICEIENKVKRPLFLVGKDSDGSYILSCGHTDEQGRLHILKVVDIRKAYAPVVELDAVKEAVAAAQSTAPPPPAKKEKKRREDAQEEE